MKKVHNYTSNLELTSLLIRIKNLRALESAGTPKLSAQDYKNNRNLNHYIKVHTKLSEGKSTPENASKRYKLKEHLKTRIIELSEKTPCDKFSYNRFGEIILLMVKKILTRPQFSGYSYKDDFYSDASFKILKYLGNFDHTMISERTGLRVNAFSYITQIIMNSILCIINNRKRENDKIKENIKLGLVDSPASATDSRNLYILDKEVNSEPEKIQREYFVTETDSQEVLDKISELAQKAKEQNNSSKNIVHLKEEVDFNIDQWNFLRTLVKEYKDIGLTFGNRVQEKLDELQNDLYEI